MKNKFHQQIVKIIIAIILNIRCNSKNGKIKEIKC